MDIKITRSVTLVVLAVVLTACPRTKIARTVTVKPVEKHAPVNTPLFNPDSAWYYIARQVEFGPRVPNSSAHTQCGDYLIHELKRFGSTVIVQETKLKAFDNTIYNARNIIGSFNPENAERIMLCAHWDSRFVADQEKDKSKMQMPIDGANDGGSGVGVLLEVARQIGQAPLFYGVDIIFFDAEDQGRPSFLPYDANSADSWCLGSQYWAAHPHTVGYNARYGILLDMVGAQNAVFPMEGYSMQFAPNIVNRVWNLAANLGFSQYFVFEKSAPVIDDHYFINKIAGIPCIDIIHYSPDNYTGFGEFWHTHNDNMDIIYKPTLFAVGSVLLEQLYQQPF